MSSDDIKFNPNLSKTIVEGDPNGLGAQLAEKAGDYALEKTGSPALAAAATTAAQVAPMVMMGLKSPAAGEFVNPMADLPGSSPGPSRDIVNVANQYMSDKDLSISHPESYAKANPERGAEIAQQFEAMPDDPNHPDVKRAYDALKSETLDQYKYLKKLGLKFTPIEPDQSNPYANSNEVINDITKNKHLYYYPTEQGFGTVNKSTQHPLLEKTNEKINGKPLLANDIFRIVHDVFGHAKEGVGFGPSGEENAWRSHMPMFSPEAQKALTTETRGQNSWVNYGPNGEHNRMNPSKTVYADQKSGILPESARKGYDEGGEVAPSDMPDTPVAQSSMKLSDAVPHEDLPSSTAVPSEDLPKSQYETPGQQAITAAESAASGATFGLSTKAETMMGVDPEEIKARQQANPLIAAGADATGTIGSMLIPGVGEGWLLAKGTKLLLPIAEEANFLAKTGRLALRGMLETAGMAGGDEIQDAFLDKGHDATAVASHIAGSGALGLLTGGVFGAGATSLEALQNAKVGSYLDDFAIGLGHGSGGIQKAADLAAIYKDAGMSLPKGVEHGIKFYDNVSTLLNKTIADKATEFAAGTIGNAVGGIPGANIAMDMARKYLDPYTEKLASRVTPGLVKKVTVPIMLQAIKLGKTSGISEALNYGTKAAQGAKLIQKSIDSLFKVSSDKIVHEMSDTDNEKLNKYIEDGGIDQQINDVQSAPQAFAKGGEVQPKPINTESGVAALYPTQNMMLTAAKARVSNYLNKLRPQPPVNKLIFDKYFDDPAKRRIYENALTIANNPLSVLKLVQDGTITAEHVQHLNNMYPELHDLLSRKIAEKLVDHQVEETKPAYKMRQGLGLFLGKPLESSDLPMSIQAAQSVFMPPPPPQQQAPAKNKKSTATLSKFSENYQTPEQARAKRADKN